jgi:hypothetical protein
VLGVEEQEVIPGVSQYGRYFGVRGAGCADDCLPGFKEIFDCVHVV